jgi:hypothetical protein
VQFPGLEVDIIPSQGHELAGSQAVAVGDQDGRGATKSADRSARSSSIFTPGWSVRKPATTEPGGRFRKIEAR